MFNHSAAFGIRLENIRADFNLDAFKRDNSG